MSLPYPIGSASSFQRRGHAQRRLQLPRPTLLRQPRQDRHHLRSGRKLRGEGGLVPGALPGDVPSRQCLEVVGREEGRRSVDLPAHDVARRSRVPRLCSYRCGPLRRLRRIQCRVAAGPSERLRVQGHHHDRVGLLSYSGKRHADNQRGPSRRKVNRDEADCRQRSEAVPTGEARPGSEENGQRGANDGGTGQVVG